MKYPQRYHTHSLYARYVPPAIWIVLIIFIVTVVVQTAWLWHRGQQVEAMQIQLQSSALLPTQRQRDAQPDPALQKSYRELLDISTQLTLPVHIWMACLRAPAQIPVRITNFDWNAATNAIDMRMSVYQRDEFTQYLQAIGDQKYPCSANLRQEERSKEGGYQLTLRLFPLHEDVADEG